MTRWLAAAHAASSQMTKDKTDTTDKTHVEVVHKAAGTRSDGVSSVLSVLSLRQSAETAPDPAAVTEARITARMTTAIRPSRPGLCAHCGAAGGALLPMLAEGGHTWVHDACWPDWFAARRAEAVAAVPGGGNG